ncbi:uncharacterized protein BDZ99DRAFT_67390 [Mytilinidion resinicola]|uniref:Uncharacterized protein n=1 Tax=Mytilinidion resinicola TaxID=574789 RepID=A0A6A6YH02_9PEZI|nr:uncharacterized protein BDZ99DRAFT_67390 [Mytilinidion resinicola]KAF2807858.1 hypothetical protein BDZ99DRAFT_67390 [Mytilinidion resinicola]
MPCHPRNPIAVTIKSLEDVKAFFYLATQRRITDIRSIELTLNANEFCDYKDDLLAMAFKQFQPDYNRNPHNITKIVIKVEGMILFTRQTYNTISPVASWYVDKRLEGLLSGRATVKEKEETPFSVISQEKAFVGALLGIRNVREVEITGKMEPDLREEIIGNTMTKIGQPVPIAPTRGRLAVNGTFWSMSYDRNRAKDKTYHPYAPKNESSSDDSSPAPRTSLRPGNVHSASSYRIETLKRIAAKPQDKDDYGPGRHGVTAKHYEYMDPVENPEGRTGNDWIIPTGKGASCVMGWNAIGDFN